MASSLALGHGGPVGTSTASSALLLSRAPLRDAPPPRTGARGRPWRAHVGPDGAHVLFAGDLYDRDSLRQALPSAVAGQDDAALYAAALAHFNADCDSRINGYYAAICWYPDERRLRLARSPINAPPLHLWTDRGRVVAASTARAAIAAGADDALNEERLADALFLNFRDCRQGWYRDIDRVPTGEIVWLDPEGARRRRFWTIRDLPSVRLNSDDAYVEAVSAEMAKGVQEVAGGFAKPATQLSGGLDSQAVASFTLDFLPDDATLKAYCWVPQAGFEPLDWPAAHGDETSLAHAFATMHRRVELEFVDTGDLPLTHQEDKIFMLTGIAPMGGGNMHWGHEILRRAAAAGHGVVFDGGFGNNGFSYDGLTGPATWMRQGRIVRAWREIGLLGGKRSHIARFFSHAIMPQLPIKLRQRLRRLRGKTPDPFESWCPLRAGFAEDHGVLARSEAVGHDPMFLDLPSAMDWRAATLAMGENDGADITLAYELLYGVPTRSPLAYRPLFELTAGIADDQYLREGETRWLARRMLKGRIPEQVRTNTSFGIQSSDWPVRFNRERAAMLDEIASLSNDPRMAQMFDLPRMERNLREWSGKNSVGGPEMALIFSAVGRGLTAARLMRYRDRRNG
ncbi:asparagine synthase-related protein [Croceicoccus sp. Ery15]|uniref:asparagine synthase-related protein n=1 Tax=Croceicoccus sp. Ery15 TaxID=1703338 RepID=UPI001E319792|nr:asparagine synthase-related protein [Croceicoccus sp. Ery15]